MSEERPFKLFSGFKPGKDFSVFLVCLLIASLFWLLNALTKTYTTVVSVPIEYTNLPEDKILTNALIDKASAEVSGSGFNLLSVSFLNSPDAILVDYDKGNLRKGFKRTEKSFGPDVIRAQVVDNLPSELSLGALSIDSIKLVLEDKSSKMVPVSYAFDNELKESYFLRKKPSSDPRQIEIQGAQSRLNKIDTIFTKEIDLSNLKTQMVKDVDLNLPEGISSPVAFVTLTIPVDEYTEGDKEVTIRKKGIKNSKELLLWPAQVKVTYLVGLSEYDNISSEDFVFEVDAADITSDKSTLLVKMVSSPENVIVQDFKPHKVEFVLQK